MTDGNMTELSRQDIVKRSRELDQDAAFEAGFASSADRRMYELSVRILGEARTQLMMALRFLDRALWKMPFVPVGDRLLLASDCRALYFNPMTVIENYRSQPARVTRAYLHTLLHCIFRHPLHTVRTDTIMWSVACDICVEAIAVELVGERYVLESDEAVGVVVQELAEREVPLTPAGVYRELLMRMRHDDGVGLVGRLPNDIALCNILFGRDSHSFWDLVRPEPQAEDKGFGEDDSFGDDEDGLSERGDAGAGVADSHTDDQAGEGTATTDATSGADADSGKGEDASDEDELDDGSGRGGDDAPGEDEPDDEVGSARRGYGGDGDTSRARPSAETPNNRQGVESEEAEYEEQSLEGVSAKRADEEVAAEWESIAQQLETALETLEKKRGNQAGRLVSNLALANRSRIDYAGFLRRFATRSEDIKLNDEEFDYLFYTYGLARYGNMPLIEPLEYKETDRLREFVIAIDTSGSCSHGLVNIFLARTYEILSQASRRGEHTNIHIVQCDAQVQSDTVITCIEDLLKYEQTFETRGFGGTDFRPVFAYVNELVETRVFEDLRGLVYFTDGFGVFPDRAPAYDVMFVFVENKGRERRVPPWAMKVVMDDEAIEELDPSGHATVL